MNYSDRYNKVECPNCGNKLNFWEKTLYEETVAIGYDEENKDFHREFFSNEIVDTIHYITECSTCGFYEEFDSFFSYECFIKRYANKIQNDLKVLSEIPERLQSGA